MHGDIYDVIKCLLHGRFFSEGAVLPRCYDKADGMVQLRSREKILTTHMLVGVCDRTPLLTVLVAIVQFMLSVRPPGHIG